MSSCTRHRGVQVECHRHDEAAGVVGVIANQIDATRDRDVNGVGHANFKVLLKRSTESMSNGARSAKLICSAPAATYWPMRSITCSSLPVNTPGRTPSASMPNCDCRLSSVQAIPTLTVRLTSFGSRPIVSQCLVRTELLWAKASGEDVNEEDKIVHRDSNGAVLQNGDTVVLIKELDVKGATFSAKRGTAVRNIRLVIDNAEQIEGKIEGQSIIILTKFVKK